MGGSSHAPAAPAKRGGNILSVSPVEEDHCVLERICADVTGAAQAEEVWQLSRTGTLSSALAALGQVEYAVVLCEQDLEPGSWKDLLEHTQRLAHPPFLIVTSRQADEYLWAEALNLGAYDVVAKPFWPAEVIRVVGMACLHWQVDRETGADPA